MTIREYQFITGIETSTSPDPATPSADNDAITKGYADDNYALRSSYFDKASNNAAIKAIAAGDRSDGQVVFNYGSNSFYRFDSSSTGTDDDDSILQPSAGSGRWIKVTSGASAIGNDVITQQFDSYVSGTTAGEAITIRNAVCLDLHNGTGTNVYRVFKTDSDLSNRKPNYFGFAKSSVSVTPQITTYTISAAYVSGNSIPITINGRSYTVSYASSSDATLQSLATIIATDEDVFSASVTVQGGNQTGTDDRVITITSKGGLTLSISGTTITGGASQPNVTLNTTQSASGGTVDIQMFGPMSGFSGLTTGDLYYLSGTAGAITNAPTDIDPVLVGQALSTTVLMISPNKFNYTFSQNQIYVRTHGSPDNTATNGTQDVEHFNFSSWSAGTSSSGGVRLRSNGADSAYSSKHHQLDGVNTSANVSALFQSYNKSTWSTLTNRGTARSRGNAFAFNGYLYGVKGMTNDSSNASVVTTNDKWNGVSWSAGTAFSAARASALTFTIGSILYVIGGMNSGGSETTDNETMNTSDVLGSSTVSPASGRCSGGARGQGGIGMGIAYNSASNTTSYSFNGTSWSAALTSPYAQYGDGSVSAFHQGQGKTISNGGTTGNTGFGSGTILSSSQTYNGSTFATATSSSNARAYAYNSVI